MEGRKSNAPLRGPGTAIGPASWPQVVAVRYDAGTGGIVFRGGALSASSSVWQVSIDQGAVLRSLMCATVQCVRSDDEGGRAAIKGCPDDRQAKFAPNRFEYVREGKMRLNKTRDQSVCPVGRQEKDQKHGLLPSRCRN